MRSGATSNRRATSFALNMIGNFGDMLDFFDFFLIGYVLAFILKDWQLTYGSRQ